MPVTTSVFDGDSVQRLGDIVCLAPKGGDQLSIKQTHSSYEKSVSASDTQLDDRLEVPHFTSGSGCDCSDSGGSGGTSCDPIPTVVNMQRNHMPY